jgi:NAD(P)H-flavin reductase
MLPRVVRVVSRRQETADTATIEVAGIDSSPVPTPFLPGQFAMLYEHGIGEIPISCSGTGESGHPQFTIRAVGRVSAALCNKQPGACLGMRGPFGRPWPVAEMAQGHVLFVAGGVGLAPLRPAIRLVLDRASPQGDAEVCIGARSPSAILYRDEWLHWRHVRGANVHVTVDHSEGSWREDVGIILGILPRRLPPAPRLALVCGPDIMMRAVAHDLLALGYQPEEIHVSLERNMKCAVGICGHCQVREQFLCRDGAVYRWDQARRLMHVREL